MSSDLRLCSECDGIFERIYPIHTYDFNKEGYVPLSCNKCGVCNDIEEIIFEIKQNKTKFSNRFLKKILKAVCNQGIPFNHFLYHMLLDNLKEEEIFSVYQLADEIVLKSNERGFTADWNFILNIIYSKLSVSSFI